MNIDKLRLVKEKIQEAERAGVYQPLLVNGTSISESVLQVENDGSVVSSKDLSSTIECLQSKNRKVTLLGIVSMSWRKNCGPICPETGSLLFLNWRGLTALKEWLAGSPGFVSTLAKVPAEEAIKLIDCKIQSIRLANVSYGIQVTNTPYFDWH